MQQTENLAPHVQEIARALQNRLDPEAIEDELRRYLEYGVPLAQAKRDIVRMHGGSLQAGRKRVADLAPEDRGVELVVKVLTVNPKEITVKGEPKRIWFGFLADESGRTSYTAWKDLDLQRGQVLRVRNAYAKKGFRDPVEVNLGDYSSVEALDITLDVKDDFAPSPGTSGAAGQFQGAPRQAVECNVGDLRDGMASVTLTVRILETREKSITTASGPKTLLEGEMADETGRAPFASWEPGALPAGFAKGAVVRVRNAYVRAFRGVPNVNFGQHATVEILPSNVLPDRDRLMEARPVTLGELESAGGGQAVRVEGVVLEVKKGSGLIFRCTQCNRVLQKRECRTHGRNEGTPDLRIKAVLDDGQGAATFFANREATEAMLGKNLAQCQDLARAAMTVDVIQDELTEILTARRVRVEGNASSDEFGLQIMADRVVFAPARPVQVEAEKLMGQVLETLKEVSS